LRVEKGECTPENVLEGVTEVGLRDNRRTHPNLIYRKSLQTIKDHWGPPGIGKESHSRSRL